MSSDTQAIRAYFFKLGLASEIADIYLALYAYGPQTISELARNSGVERTRIYRLMDDLRSSSLVEVEIKYKRNVFHAAPITNLQTLIAKKEQEVRELQTELHDIHRKLSVNHLHSAATRIQTYQGAEGLRQMYWNETRATTENLAILYETMQVRTGLSFFERWVRACNEKEIQFRGIISDHFISTLQAWYSEYSNERLADWTPRYVPEGLFPINHSTVIYNDVTAYYNWKDGEVFGMEIRNQEIADAQRQLFEMLWQQALPVDDLKGLITGTSLPPS